MNRIYITNNDKIDSTMSGEEKGNVLSKFMCGKFQMLWVSPERFQMEEFRKSIQKVNINYSIGHAVIDEVHCMSEWGHDFRTSYLHLVKTIKNYISSAILVGLTATASDRVLKDLKIEFNIQNDVDIVTTSDFVRKELKYRVIHCNEDEKKLVLNKIINHLQEKQKILECIRKKNESKFNFFQICWWKKRVFSISGKFTM